MAENSEQNNPSLKTKSEIINVILSFKHVFMAEHVFGIYRFSVRDRQIVPPTWLNKLYSLCLIVLNITTYTVFLDLSSILEGTASVVKIANVIPCVVILIQFVLLLINTTMFYNKIHHEMFATLADLDSELMISKPEFYRRASSKNKKILGFLLVTHTIISIADVTVDNEIDIGTVIFLPLFLVHKLEVMVFCLIIESLRKRLEMINDCVQAFLDDKGDIAVFTVEEKNKIKTINMIGRPSSNNMKIRDLATMYDSIGSICSMVNGIFNLQIFMTLVSTFCYIVITIWTSLYYYRMPENHSGALVTIIIWCTTTLFTVATMCFVCERLRSMRNCTRVLVNQLIMDYDLPRTMRVQAKAFMELIEAWPLRIMIYDMFSVDISLMLKFISVSTTYLIVIIQVSHFA